MKISSLEIHNFRSIIDGSFALGNYSLLIGPNNSGKSNIIDALRVFYEKGEKFIDERDFPKCTIVDKESWIDVEFVLTDEEFSTVKDEYQRPDNRLRVRKYLKSDDRKTGIYGYCGEEISQNLFYGAKGVQQGKLGDIIYIPAVSKLDDETKFTGPSPLRDLVNDIIKKLIHTSPSFEALTHQFETFASAIKMEETEDAKSLLGLEDEINEEIAEWGVAFDFGINPVDDSSLIKNLIDFKIIDSLLGEKIEAQRQGQGFQRHLIYTLIRLSAKYQMPAKASERKEFSPQMTLILFEEPEAYLHPSQQDILSASLKNLAAQAGHQVLLSSHSPHFVSHNSIDIPSIIRLGRYGPRTEIGQIDQAGLEKIFAENQLINTVLQDSRYAPEADDLKQDMEAIKYFMWLSPERCGLFFAKHVLLVEGQTERLLFKYLYETRKLCLPYGRVFVLDCMGKFNIHRFMNILGGLRIPHSILFDADINQEPHPRIRQLVQESRNCYTTRIAEFPTNIEEFLGIEKTKKHRKPQHVLLNLHEGRVDEERINELVNLYAALTT